MGSYKAIITLLLAGVANCSELKLVHPTQLKSLFHGEIYGKEEEGVITSSLGNYGDFNWGNSIRGRAHYPTKNQDGCREFTDDDFNGEHLEDARKHRHAPIIMVDRGNCKFTHKSKHIMDYGGVMAIIVDNKKNEKATNLIMADDGTGNAVKIPSFLIGYIDGTLLKDAIFETEEIQAEEHDEKNQNEHKDGNSWKRTKNNRVIVQGNINVATRSNNAEDIRADMWYSSIYELYLSDLDLKAYSDILLYLQSHIKFQPRMLTYSCLDCPQEQKDRDCVANGAVCPIYPHAFRKYKKHPSLVVAPETMLHQMVREACTWQAINPGQQHFWFLYMKHQIEKCLVPMTNWEESELPLLEEKCSLESNKDISEAVNQKPWMDQKKFDSCLQHEQWALGIQTQFSWLSFANETLIKKDMNVKKEIGNVIHPSITVNGQTLRGGEKGDPNAIFKSLCSTIDHKPGVCSKTNIKFDVLNKIMPDSTNRDYVSVEARNRYEEYDKNLVGMSRRARTAEVILGLVIVFLLNIACFLYCKGYNKEKTDVNMQTAVNEQVSQYFALAANESDATQMTNRSVTSGDNATYQN